MLEKEIESSSISSVNSVAKKRVHFETWGCQMNVADSETMLAQLEKKDYRLTQSAEDADLIVLNTCHIREKASHKVLSRLGVLSDLKIQNPALTIAVTGCVAQAEGQKLIDKSKSIDVLIGPGKVDQINDVLDRFWQGGKPVVSVGFDRHEVASSSDSVPDSLSPSSTVTTSISGKPEISRFVNIIQGCNNYCTFCVVPFTRGREISRTHNSVLEEVRNLSSSGVREVTLLGQNVNSYGLDLIGTDLVPEDGGPFVKLLTDVCAIPGIERVRFTTSNPHDFSPALAKLFFSHEKMGKHMHLPVQSGSDRILESMKRKVTRRQYLEKIDMLRQNDPKFAVSTDLIVGFPDETDADFQDTLSLLECVRFSFVYAFVYSQRKQTAASRFRSQIPESIKKSRLAKLNQVQDRITQEIVDSEIGCEFPALFLYQSKKYPGIYVGRTAGYRTVRVHSTIDIIGQTLPVRIDSGNKVASLGTLV